MNKQTLLNGILSLALAGSLAFNAVQATSQPSAPPNLLALSEIDGTLVFVPISGTQAAPTPSPTATRTPVPTPTRVTPASPTPFEVTPIAPTPDYPRDRQANLEYIPIYKLRIRVGPEPSAAWTGAYVFAGERYMVYHVREYADGTVWGCMDNTHPNNCRRWFAIWFLENGVLKEYARPAEDLDG